MKPTLHRCRFTAFLAVVVMTLLPSAPTAAAAENLAPSTTAPCQATAHNENASHTGSSCTSLPALPTMKWSVTLNGPASYPIIADGKVYVATSSSGSYGGWLYALDASSGKVAWGPVPLAATYYWFALAYGDGKVYVNNFDGTVTAYNASTGRQAWAQATGSDFSGEPVAYKDVVYVQGAASVFALSEETGKVIWSSGYLDGDGSSVSANASGVYVAAGCSWYRLSLANGAVVWSGNSGCTGGGGGTTYLSNGLDFETVGSLIVRAETGKTVGSFSGVPAFSGTDGYFATGSSVFCENVKTLTPVFTAQVPSTITTSPVIAGQRVYVGTANAKVYALNTTSGKVVWHGALPAAPGGGGQYSSPVSDIAVGQGLLVVPTGDHVTAFG